MTATYDPSLGDDISRMRQAVGDTDLAEPFEPDVTYTALLLESSDWRLAAAALARSLAARAINRPGSFTSVGDLTVSWNDRASAWLRLATALETAYAHETSTADNGVGFSDPVRPVRQRQRSGYSNGLRGWR